MKERLLNLFINFVRWVSGPFFSSFDHTKMISILNAAGFLVIFILFFIVFYFKYAKNVEERLMFWVTSITLLILIFAKFIISHFWRDYIADRLIFYVLPSPQAKNIIWFLLPIIIFVIFIKYQKKIELLPSPRFLSILYFIFVFFSLSVAGIRGGIVSIVDPFTRTYWEYSGYLPLISNIHDFLGHYTLLFPKIAIHMMTHPPGYVLFLYFFYKMFSVGPFGLTVALVSSVGLILWPLYYFLKKLFDEDAARYFLQVFIFSPSIVMFTVTSMDSLFMVLVWVSIVGCFLGWRKKNWFVFIGGIGAACAFFSNFLFLLLCPFFIWLTWYSIKKSTHRLKTCISVLYSLIVFTIFFIVIRYWSGYSIIDNFFIARLASQMAVPNNFESFSKYLIYLFISLTDFLIYLGIPYLYLLSLNFIQSWKTSDALFRVGVYMVIFFLIAGLFQGETGRIWLFMVPFFVLGNPILLLKEKKYLLPAYLSLTFFQIIIIQTLFYTYW